MVTEKNVQPTKTFTEIARFDLKNILGIGPCLIFVSTFYIRRSHYTFQSRANPINYNRICSLMFINARIQQLI